jgi:hypothetical protein
MKRKRNKAKTGTATDLINAPTTDSLGRKWSQPVLLENAEGGTAAIRIRDVSQVPPGFAAYAEERQQWADDGAGFHKAVREALRSLGFSMTQATNDATDLKVMEIVRNVRLGGTN